MLEKQVIFDFRCHRRSHLFGLGAKLCVVCPEVEFGNFIALKITNHTVLAPFPVEDQFISWSYCNLFSGGFCGWSQAAEILGRDRWGHSVDRQLFVDYDTNGVECLGASLAALMLPAPVSC